jgi:hypothetical protein
LVIVTAPPGATLLELLVVVELDELLELVVMELLELLLVVVELLLELLVVVDELEDPFGNGKKLATKLKLVVWLTIFASSTLPMKTLLNVTPPPSASP